jgi:NitT/TauT family transport system permease protein
MDQPRPLEHAYSPARRGLPRSLVLLPFSIAGALALWWLIARVGQYPPVILPTPELVGARFLAVLRDGTLLRHAAATLQEVLAGLALGGSTAVFLGYLLAKSIRLERALSPYIVASQSVPVVAIAPLLVIWFGPGPFSKMLISALIVFFPILVNTIVGVRSVSDDLRDLMRSLGANRWQTFKLLEAPASLAVVLGGLRIGATLSVIGAVVGEFIGANRGLGFLINRAKGQYDTPLVFVAVLALVLMALALYGAVVLLENRWLAWRARPEKQVW